MHESQAEITLDLSGLLCPLPVLKAKKRLAGLRSGDILTVIATDPMSAIDMPHFCNEQGHVLLAQRQEDGIFIYRIRRK